MSRSRRSDLLAYRSTSSVAVGDHGLSPFESTLILGGILLVAGGVVYWLAKPVVAAVTPSSPTAPVPVPPVVQPIPTPSTDPSSPGY